MRRVVLGAIVVAVLAALAVVVAAWPRAEFIPARSPEAWAPSQANIARGAYLARAGDCMACHTARGGLPYAGGRALATPFGTVHAPNITPDAATGIGTWTADDFWHALHNGIAPGGRLLYPAFPYPNTTKVTRDDADALYAYLRSLPPVRQPNRAHALRFPYDSQAVLAGWRLLYFKPGVYAPQPARGADWNRGAYLVDGLGHCGACHSPRNGLGATGSRLSGGAIPMAGWYAPALDADDEAGLGQWDRAHIVQLLRTGVAPRGAVFGPMAEVVGRSLQYLTEADAGAMATYLKSLPPEPTPRRAGTPPPDDVMKAGRTLYAHHCADCHGTDGRGTGVAGHPAYPPLAGNGALTMADPVNAIRIVLNGGFPPSTSGNPRPFGMPPHSPVLDDAEVAAVVTYVRNSWGNAAPAVAAPEVNRWRAVPLD
ncbi:c-type cytochrome [Massilia sp. TW-1]|uniref:C-type cytochrome n=1 Tax=Telluria antibiotica TaxID=2717319 RepID=A0ABX0PIV2_9BURK|nr:cytochrome c [Telluria antibiotica]NIA57102.1 c-type cytochrome [Telluria antibiotica]